MYALYQHGKPLLVTENEMEVIAYMHKNTYRSISSAFEHEGYTLTLNGVDITKNYILKDIKK